MIASISISYKDAHMLLKEGLEYEHKIYTIIALNGSYGMSMNGGKKMQYYRRELSRVRLAINSIALEIKKDFQ